MPDESNNRALSLELPIFPLPLVMLPNEVLPLYIFEDRYRQMLLDIGGQDGVFGISRSAAGIAADEPRIGSVGCAARISRSDTSADGTSNIVTVGTSRFRIIGYAASMAPYLVAEVEYFRDEPETEELSRQLTQEVYKLFKRVADAALKMNARSSGPAEIPHDDPEGFSFMVAAALGFDDDLKSRFLHMTSTVERLKTLSEVLQTTVGQIEESAEIIVAAKTNGHSKKKLDL